VDASGQALKALAGLPLTLHVHDKPMHFPFIVVKRLSVPLIIGCDFQRQYTKAILLQDGKFEWSTGAVSDILCYHLGARGRQCKAPAKPRVRPNELTLAGAPVLPTGAQTEVQVVTRSTGSCLIKGRAEFLAKQGLHLAHGHHKKVHRYEYFSVLLVNLGRKTKTFAKRTRVGVVEPYTGEARPLSQGALLAVKKELEARKELDTQAAMAEAEGPPEPPVVPPTKEPETPEVNWAGVPKELHGKVHGLLDQFKGMWSGKPEELKATTHHIQLQPDAKPVCSASYRALPHRRLEIEKQVKKMLYLGVIEPSDAEWSFPVVVVPKPGGHFRFFVDYRRLNARPFKDVYPIPRMDDCLDSLGDATVFSTLDWNTELRGVDKEQPFTLERMLAVQKEDQRCQDLRDKMDQNQHSRFSDTKEGLLVRVAPLDGAVQLYVQFILRQDLLRLEHSVVRAGHLGVNRMYASIRRHDYWESMAAEGYDWDASCSSCARNRIAPRRRTAMLKLFPATDPFASLSVDLLGSLKETKTGNVFLLIMVDRFSKLVRAVPLDGITSTDVSSAFCRDWISVYGPPDTVLTDNGPQFFQGMCSLMGIRNL